MNQFSFYLFIISLQISINGVTFAQDTLQKRNTTFQTNSFNYSKKITQARMIEFRKNDVIVYALEEFSKPPKLVFQKDDIIKYSFEFDSTFSSGSEFSFTGHGFLRFKEFEIKGLPSPLVIGVTSEIGGSDTGYQIVLAAEIDSKNCSINPEKITMSQQDGIFLGYINKEYQYGMIRWKFIWKEAHYDPHRYEISIYKWVKELNKFLLCRKFNTSKKFTSGQKALQHYNLPYYNFRSEVVLMDGELSTLGIENYLLNSK